MVHAEPVIGGAGAVALHDLLTGATLDTRPSPGAASIFASGVQSRSILASNTRCVVAGGSPGVVQIYALTGGVLGLLLSDVGTARVKDLAITPKGNRAVVVFDNAPTRVYDLGPGTLNPPMAGTPGAGFPPGGGAVRAVAASDARAIAAGTTVQIYDLAAATPGTVLDFASPFPGGFYEVAITPDGTRAIALQDDTAPGQGSHVHFFDLTGTPSWIASQPVSGHPSSFSAGVQTALIETSIVTTDAFTAVLTAADHSIGTLGWLNFFDPSGGAAIGSSQGLTGHPHDMALGEKGDRLVVHDSNMVTIWDAGNTGAGVPLLSQSPSPGFGYFFFGPSDVFIENSVSIAKGRAVVVGNDIHPSFGVQRARMSSFDLASGQQLGPMSAGPNGTLYHQVALTADGYFAVAHRNGFPSGVDVMEAGNGNMLPTLGGTGTALPTTVNSIAIGGRHVLDVGASSTSPMNTNTAIHALCPPPQNILVTNPNSTGQPGVMGFVGSTSVALNNAAVTAAKMPAGDVGQFAFSSTLAATPLVFPSPAGQPPAGIFYLNGAQFLAPQTIGVAGNLRQSLNLPAIAVIAGQTLYFQFVFFDSARGVTNTTDVLDLCFQP